ncbi:hypothetical protein ACH347_18790 [Saccharopolyspora sp. 5N102]|uniref:hypothetical protein n=1 Tax=Saccharopolyspora sp. 5N102 TaxID=3375155 RepID=UPI003787E395
MGNALTVIAALTSVAGAVVTVLLGARFERRRHLMQRQQERQDHTDRYSGPLLAAASSLASRLRNVMDSDQIKEFTEADDQRSHRYGDYAVKETLYRIGRYLCWVHIISREIRVLDLGNEKRNRELVLRLGAVQHAILSRDGDLTFMLLGGEQWALGELMVDPDHPADDPRCISYVRFVDRLDDPQFARWFQSLKQDIDAYLEDPVPARPRLASITKALDNLVALLDPRRIWAPFDETIDASNTPRTRKERRSVRRAQRQAKLR